MTRDLSVLQSKKTTKPMPRRIIKKILIANRGEIACRIIKTCRELNLSTVSVYSDVDAQSQHVLLADEAYLLGGSSPSESYLNADKILHIAQQAAVDAIHPGYGFLSENAAFARSCEQQQIIFIGPKASTMDKMAAKDEAKRIMEQAQVPVVPGYHGREQSAAHLIAQAKKIGFPVMIKAAAGGGGKGMRIVHQADQFCAALESAQREALKSFADDRVILESYLLTPRHIEVQVFADQRGNIVHLFERECSVQRRYQKVIEETPAPILKESTRKLMLDAALSAAKAVDYVGAGTVEFIVDSKGQFYFMEMNTRLQVEHAVTEQTTGIDLVAWQIQIASGEELPKRQEDIKQVGHSIETRIYAEDPYNQFLPSTGRINHLQFPENTDRSIRIDSGVIEGDSVSIFYDPMIAKIISWGDTRETAITRLQDALATTHIQGLKTNIRFIESLIVHPMFINAQIDTAYLDQNIVQLTEQVATPPDLVKIAAALALIVTQDAIVSHSPWMQSDAWRLSKNSIRDIHLTYDHSDTSISIHGFKNTYLLTINSIDYAIQNAQWIHHKLCFEYDNCFYKIPTHLHRAQIDLHWQAIRYPFTWVDPLMIDVDQQHNSDQISAPMPGRIIKLLCKVGEHVEPGQTLLILEAMKMEISIEAPHTGQIAKINFAEGEFVEADTLLVLFEQEDTHELP